MNVIPKNGLKILVILLKFLPIYLGESSFSSLRDIKTKKRDHLKTVVEEFELPYQSVGEIVFTSRNKFPIDNNYQKNKKID